MEPSDLLKMGRLPVLSGPDSLELALGIVEPVAMGTVREVSFRIRASESGGGVAAVRGSVVGVEHGAGRGFYDVTVAHFDGSYALVRGYHPQDKHCLSLTWSDRLDDVAQNLVDRQTNRSATWNLNRHGLVHAIIHMGLIPWRSTNGQFRVDLGSEYKDVELTSPEHPSWVYRAADGLITARLIGVIRCPDSGKLAVQFTDGAGKVLHGFVNADGALQWVHLGRAWWHIERLAS